MEVEESSLWFTSAASLENLLVNWLEQEGFRRCIYDLSLFFRKYKIGEYMYIGKFVDDFFILADDKTEDYRNFSGSGVRLQPGLTHKELPIGGSVILAISLKGLCVFIQN